MSGRIYIYIYTWVAVLIDPALLRLLITRHKNPRPLPSRPKQHTRSILSIAISSQLLFLQLTSISYYRNRFRPLPANIWFRGSHNFMKSETRIQKSTVFLLLVLLWCVRISRTERPYWSADDAECLLARNGPLYLLYKRVSFSLCTGKCYNR